MEKRGLRQIREGVNVTVERLSGVLKMSPSRIIDFETGKGTLTIVEACAIAYLMGGISLDEFCLMSSNGREVYSIEFAKGNAQKSATVNPKAITAPEGTQRKADKPESPKVEDVGANEANNSLQVLDVEEAVATIAGATPKKKIANPEQNSGDVTSDKKNQPQKKSNSENWADTFETADKTSKAQDKSIPEVSDTKTGKDETVRRKEIGKLVMDTRLAKGISYNKMKQLLKMTMSEIINYENGVPAVQEKFKKQISELLGIPIDQLEP